MVLGITAPAGTAGIVPGVIVGVATKFMEGKVPMLGGFEKPGLLVIGGYLAKNDVLMTLGGYELGRSLVANTAVAGDGALGAGQAGYIG